MIGNWFSLPTEGMVATAYTSPPKGIVFDGFILPYSAHLVNKLVTTDAHGKLLEGNSSPQSIRDTI